MLILTRRVGDKIVIGSNIVVVVLGWEGNQVKIGIEAPDDVKILRNELIERALKLQKEMENEKS